MDARLGIARQRPLPVFVRRNLPRWFRGRRPAVPTRRADAGPVHVPGRLVHQLHRAGHRPGRRRAARGCRAGTCALESAAAAAGRASPRACWTTPQKAGAPGAAAGATAPSRARRSSAASRPACSPCAPSTGRCCPTTRRARRRRPGAPGRGAARRGDRRRPAGAARGLLARRTAVLFHGHCHQKAEVGTAATVALLRADPRRRGRRARRRMLRDGRVVRLRGRALRRVDGGRRATGSSRRSWPSPPTRSSPRRASPAASRSTTAPSGTRWHPVELVRSALADA